MSAELFVDLKWESAMGGTTLVSDVGLGGQAGRSLFLGIIMGSGARTALSYIAADSPRVSLSHGHLHPTVPGPVPHTVRAQHLVGAREVLVE